jgi:hypothetical protein
VNSFERYAATIAGKPTDFLPRVPILMQFAAEHIGSNYGAFALITGCWRRPICAVVKTLALSR